MAEPTRAKDFLDETKELLKLESEEERTQSMEVLKN